MVKAVCNVAAAGKKCDGSPETGEVRGTVTLEQQEGGQTTISWRITGLVPGQHGFHIHEKADFSEGCKRYVYLMA
jgi:Cu/Zn superoxide dismutase